MTNVMNAHMNEIGISTILESSGSQIESSPLNPWARLFNHSVPPNSGEKNVYHHLRTHTTKWLSYTLLYKMASKTSKISRL